MSRLLELNLHGGGAELPQFLLEGFLVPHDEDLHEVLRDDEVLDVEPSSNGTAAGALVPPLPLPAGAVSPLPRRKRQLPAEQTVRGVGGAAAVPKRSRQEGAGVMAIGWQAPTSEVAANVVAPPSVSAVGASAVEKSSTSEDTGTDDDCAGSNAVTAAAAAQNLRPRGSNQQAAPSGGRGAGRAASADGDASALAKAAALSTCGKSADSPNEEDYGIFVGGIGPGLNDVELLKFFSRYGEVESASVVYNQSTGKSKGFAFVQFADAGVRARVLAEGPKFEIAGRMTEVKPRKSKGGTSSGKGRAGKGGKEGGGRGSKGGQHGAGGGRGGMDNKRNECKDGASDTRIDRMALPQLAEQSSSSSDEGPASAPPKKLVGSALAQAPAPAQSQAPQEAAARQVPAAAPPTAHQQQASASLPLRSAKKKGPAMAEDEAAIQRQMAALGLPVSFKASANEKAASSDSDEGDEEEEEDGEDEDGDRE